MRVGFNAQKARERETGIGNYAWHLACALARLPEAAGRLNLYLLSDARIMAESTNGVRLVSREAKWSGNVARILWEQLGLPRAAARDRLDLIHYIDHALPVFYRPCPVIITVHDLAFYRLPQMYNRSRRMYKQFVGIRSARHAAHVIVNSEATKREVMELTGISLEKITVIPYGLDPVFHPSPEANLLAARQKFALTKPFFLFVGTLQPRKNLRSLISAFARLVQAREMPHELVLAGGEGWLCRDLVAYAGQRRIADRVRFLGTVPHAELPALYQMAEALVYPSWHEGFGLPPLEAMACATPVVASNIAAIREVVGKAGVLVEPADVEGLAQAMAEVVMNPKLRQRLREQGPERAQRFSWTACAKATWLVYRRVFEESQGSRNA